jgi:glyoxylase-like metal-dependent hydrolase (beta-lactamase superfamily II)
MAKWFEVTFFAVCKASKGGDAILVRWESEKESPESILIDGGYAGTYADLIERLPDEIDHVVCSHLDRDHIGGLLELLHDKRKKCSNLWITMTRELLNETAALGRVGANSPEGRVELVWSGASAPCASTGGSDKSYRARIEDRPVSGFVAQ